MCKTAHIGSQIATARHVSTPIEDLQHSDVQFWRLVTISAMLNHTDICHLLAILSPIYCIKG